MKREAGSELDTDVATKVMGLSGEFVAPYSTEMAAAWMIVEHLGVLFPGETFAVHVDPYWKDHQPDPSFYYPNPKKVYAYEAGFLRTQDYDDGGGAVLDDYCKVFAEADTAPLAICLAALDAVGAA